MKKNVSEIHITVDSREKLVGRAYVPEQLFADVYDPKAALEHGTAFCELSMPYRPKSKAGFCKE